MKPVPPATEVAPAPKLILPKGPKPAHLPRQETRGQASEASGLEKRSIKQKKKKKAQARSDPGSSANSPGELRPGAYTLGPPSLL